MKNIIKTLTLVAIGVAVGRVSKNEFTIHITHKKLEELMPIDR